MYEIDALIAGFVGGFIGASAVIAAMWLTFKAQYKEYLFAKEGFKTRMKLMKIIDEVQALKLQIAAINATIYHSVTESEYK